MAFYDLAFNQHKLDEAVRKYVAEPYIQHNPTVADGGKAFIDSFAPFLKENPQSRAEVKRAAAEGDLVWLHVFSRTSPQDRGEAVVDIFRVNKAGKIVEHWDVIQAVPEKNRQRTLDVLTIAKTTGRLKTVKRVFRRPFCRAPFFTLRRPYRFAGNNLRKSAA